MRASQKIFKRAKKLRGEMTLPEIILWDCLRAGRLSGHRFRRQHPIGPYVLDFYCAVLRLAIEVDGAHHDLPGQMSHDAARDTWLAGKGVRVMRLPATDILDEHALSGALRLVVSIADGAEIPSAYLTREAVALAPPPPPTAVPLPRERGRIKVADGLDAGSSPAKRGRGTMRSMVEGAHLLPDTLPETEPNQ